MITLSESQKFQILCILRDLASVDHNLELVEAIRIRLIGLKMDLHEDTIEEALAEDIRDIAATLKCLAFFTQPEQKKYLYQQCLLLLMADREISGVEADAMEAIRVGLSLDRAFHDQIVAWVREGMEWERRGEDLVGGSLEE